MVLNADMLSLWRGWEEDADKGRALPPMNDDGDDSCACVSVGWLFWYHELFDVCI